MLTVRLSPKEEKKLSTYCIQEGVAKSQVVKEALVAYFAKANNEVSPYQAGEDLFGQHGSNEVDKSATYKKRIKQKLNEKHSH